MKKYLFIVLLFSYVFGQDKFQPGNTNFNSVDRIAINDVIDAYGIY